MSTGAECHFYEKFPQKWYYEIQDWPYGEWSGYQTHGPFKDLDSAQAHLDGHYANPGGWTVSAFDIHKESVR